MAVAQLAFGLNVSGSNPGDFFYTPPAVMAMTDGVHAAISCIAFSASGQIDVWIQTSDDLENWQFLGGAGGTPPVYYLFRFTGVGAQQQTVASTSTFANYGVPVGALWIRFVFRVTLGSGVSGTFAVRANSFLA